MLIILVSISSWRIFTIRFDDNENQRGISLSRSLEVGHGLCFTLRWPGAYGVLSLVTRKFSLLLVGRPLLNREARDGKDG